MLNANYKRIARNTLMLYIRMGVTMLVSLFTSRIVLRALGVEDFGIYNLTGGVVALFSFLNAAMSASCQRFLCFELGAQNLANVGKVFATSRRIHWHISILVIILAESVGLWFVNTRLNIPAERMHAANWVYQCSVVTTFLGILQVPYYSLIIAHEKMNVFAWSGMLATFMRLGIVYLLLLGGFDRLIVYSLLVMGTYWIMLGFYIIYCHITFPAILNYRSANEWMIRKTMISFSGWSLLGSVANVSAQQGVNIVLNIFCGVTVNAAYGIANQVNGVIYQFISNFQQAFNPQIVKLYSANDLHALEELLHRASKYSFYLMYLLSLPLLLNTEFVLQVWLGVIPPYTAAFLQWTLFFFLIESVSAPLWMSIQATGKIRKYQMIVSFSIFCNLPLSILIVKSGYSPVFVIAAKSLIDLLLTLWRILFLSRLIRISARDYFRKVIVNITIGAIVAGVLPFIVAQLMAGGWSRMLLTGLMVLVCVPVTTYTWGSSREERRYFTELIRGKVSCFLHGIEA